MRLPLEYAVLGILMQRPMHGYEVSRYLSSGLKGVWSAGISNIYGILKKLEADGHVLSRVETQGNRPARRVFSISERGKEYFRNWVSEPVESIRDLRVEFMAKLYFVKDLGIPKGDQLVEKQKDVCQAILDSLERPEDEGPQFNRLLFDFRRCQIQTILAWLDRCRGYLKMSPDASQKGRRRMP
jgi:DNA-binding PadR family transcriptional regulator